MTLETHSLQIKGWWQKLNLLPFFLGLWIHCPDNKVINATVYFRELCSHQLHNLFTFKFLFLFVCCESLCCFFGGFFKIHAQSVLEDYWLARNTWTSFLPFTKKCKLTLLQLFKSTDGINLETPQAEDSCWSAQLPHFSKIAITALKHNNKWFECFIKALRVLGIPINLSSTVWALNLTGELF